MLKVEGLTRPVPRSGPSLEIKPLKMTPRPASSNIVSGHWARLPLVSQTPLSPPWARAPQAPPFSQTPPRAYSPPIPSSQSPPWVQAPLFSPSPARVQSLFTPLVQPKRNNSPPHSQSPPNVSSARLLYFQLY